MLDAKRLMRKSGRYMIDLSIEERIKDMPRWEGPLDIEEYDDILNGLKELRKEELTAMWWWFNEYFEMLADEGVIYR